MEPRGYIVLKPAIQVVLKKEKWYQEPIFGCWIAFFETLTNTLNWNFRSWNCWQTSCARKYVPEPVLKSFEMCKDVHFIVTICIHESNIHSDFHEALRDHPLPLPHASFKLFTSSQVLFHSMGADYTVGRHDHSRCFCYFQRIAT